MDLSTQQHTAKCPICNSSAVFTNTILFKYLVGIIDEYEQNYFVCNTCDFIFTSNYLDDTLIENYYKNISKYEGDAKGKVDISKRLMSQRQFDFINNSNISYETVLEIGASTGFNLSTFKQHNKIVYGVEPSTLNKKNALELYEIDLFDGMYEEFYKLNNEKKYDLIIMSHVLEHIHNPNEIIKKLNKQNNKFIYIEVPSFEVQIESEPYGSFFYEHVNHFTTNSLSFLMNQNGYNALSISINYNVNGESPNYPVICSLWEKNDKTSGKKTILHSSFLINNYLSNSENKFKLIQEKVQNIPKNSKIAIWGTGSHTSRLLGMTNLLEKNIVKFYDSDKKKYQFKILDKQITAFDENDINNGLVDTIIISTFSGEKAILKYINSLNVDINVVTLYN